MQAFVPRLNAILLSGFILSGLAVFGAAPSQAQSALCPTSVGTQTGLVLSGGTCTNAATNVNGTGAFSGAALATQALSDLSQSATQETVRNTSSALATRREAEQQRCPDGFTRINGTCQRNTPVVAPVSPSPVLAPIRPRLPAKTIAAGTRHPRRQVAARRLPPPTVALPVPVLYPAPIYQSHFGAWAQGFGNSEDRSATAPSSIDCCTAIPGQPGGLPIGLTVNEKSHANTYGFLGGMDYTARSLARADDGLILGLLVGYLQSDFDIKTTTTSSNPALVGNGSGTVHANLSGASTGVYGTYFSGPFTADLTFKADIFDLSEHFSDLLAYSANTTFGAFPGSFSGSGSGGLTNLSTFGNVSYRLFTFGPVWIEPTAGFQYTDSLYDGRAKRELGLDDGELVMLQAGARVGMDQLLANQQKLTTSLTGLAYDDVKVSGGFIQSGFFGSNVLGSSDEGKLRGRGILAINYELGNGVNVFAQGDVYGGDGLFGAGGKGGLRVQW